MSWLSLLLKVFREEPPLPELAPPPPDGMARLHLFAGQFSTEAEATAYVFDAPDSNHPEPFTNDLPDAFIDPQFIEVAYGERALAAAQLIPGRSVNLDGADTLLIVSEKAFGGLPFALNDTPRVRYLGMWEVPA